MGTGMLLKDGLQVLVLGLGITVLALSLLILVIQAINRILNKNEKENTSSSAEKPSSIEETIETTHSQNEVDDKELVAVISVAIAAMLGDNDSKQPFKIKKIKQIPASTSRWNQTSRREQMLNNR